MRTQLTRPRALPLAMMIGVSVLGSLALAGPATDPPAPPPSDHVFPTYDSIAGNVEFWIRVFAEWTVGQVVVHDLEHPALIYEVVSLPGPIEDRYTDRQREFTEELREAWEQWLVALEHKVANGDPLDTLEKEWALHIATTIGSERLTGAHERIRTQRGLRERFREGIERSMAYEAEFRAIFAEAGLPEELAYLPHVESSFRPDARSSAGAVGLWQFTRGTGRQYMRISSAIDERLDPVAATLGAASYLRDAYEQLGSWPLALTSYNYGVQGMLRAKASHGTDFDRIYRDYDGRRFGFASKNFYAEFLAAREIARSPERYFPEGLTAADRLELDQVILERRASPQQIARAYGVPLDELATLNPAWTERAVRRGLAVPEGTRVWLPRGLAARGGGRNLPAVLTGACGEIAEHLVQRGDSLSTIAAIHGVSMSDLRSWNGLARNDDLIRVGQKLRVAPETAMTRHTVRPGETLSEIAIAHGMRLDELREMNGIPRGSSLIRVGQRLEVCADGPEWIHVVRPGETLSEIAVAYGIDLTDLRDRNAIAPQSSMIRVGQKLRVPSHARTRAPSTVHVVRHGDTLLGIATSYGVKLADLLAANHLSIRSIIHPGQNLHVPLVGRIR